MRKLFIVGGTWEFRPHGIQQEIVHSVNKNWIVEWISYPARYGDGAAYLESVAIGKANLERAISAWPGEFSISGFSQGAKIAGDIAQKYHSNKRFLRAYLIADPSRSAEDRLIGPPVTGHGISGERKIGWKANHFVAPGDFIGANDNAFMSNVARYTYNMSSVNPIGWVRSFSEAAKNRKPGGDVIAAFRAISYYLTSQVHTKYNSYIVEGVSVPQWIARDLNRWS